MAEWMSTNDGRPLKTTDALLDWGVILLARNVQLEIENVQLREDLAVAMECALVR